MNPPPRRATLTRVLALGIAAIVLLVPGNLLPFMFVRQAGELPTEPEIGGGVRLFVAQGFWGLAAIVFIASVVVPFVKLAGLAILWRAAVRGDGRHPEGFTRLHGLLDYIGRWSMLDVFLAAFLSGAVRFGPLASVEPRRGIVAFAAVVALTMLATRAFDPRLLWTTALGETPHPVASS